MATTTPTAQELSHRVAFGDRVEVDDGYGNTRGEFQAKFTRWAALRHRGGSESVMASRLEGRNVLGVYVRKDTETRTITSDWRMMDETGTEYAINIVDAVTDRRFVYIQAQSGVAV